MSQSSKKILSACCDKDGIVLAEWKSANVANAQRRAQWMLRAIPLAVRAFVPNAQYEVAW